MFYIHQNLIVITTKNEEQTYDYSKIWTSQEKFALSIDMDRTYYASVESGKRNISINNIEKIAKGFNVSLEELFKDL